MAQQHLPEKIDKYQILSVLGKGAMGIVYHAYDPIVKRDVAIKLLSSLDVEEPELISRFEREARLAGGLRHPNVVTIYDLGHFEGRPYIVMEYIVGRDLETIIKEKQPMAFEQKLETLLEITKGLVAAHQKGIIHRDIKPANIRIQEDGSVKIMDFGIARMGTSQLTRSGYIIGTLQYMSPEQVSGEILDARTDIFSTGVIGYELFTGINPFAGGSAVDIMYRILNVRPQPVRDLPEEYGTELNQMLMRAIEKNKDLRYGTVKEMAQDLEEFLFYIKTLKFHAKATGRVTPFQEPGTQAIPADQLPGAPSHEPVPTMHAPPAAPTKHAEMPPTISAAPRVKLPTFGQPEPEKAPRTGIGANYSETAQRVLMRPAGGWQEKKFFVLGILAALVFLGALFYFAGFRGVSTSGDLLKIDSDPTGAEVWIGDRKIGKTPLTLSPRQDATLVFRMKGYLEKIVPLSKEAWPPEVHVVMEAPGQPGTGGPTTPLETILRVVTTPPGASVQLDGQPAGTTPAEVKIPPDKQQHRIALQLQGYEPAEQTVDVNTSSPLTVQLKQLPEPGTVRYAGQYRVTILSDGNPMPGPTFTMQPGDYTFTMVSRKGAYIRKTEKITVISGETVTLRQPAMGQINIKANPSNCRISINGEYIDEAPIFNYPIQAGAHVIQFNWETLGKRLAKPVEITTGDTTTVVGFPE